MSGWAQVNGGKFLTPEEKDDYDEYYIRNATPWFDLYIVGRTLKVIFRRGAKSDHEVAAASRVGFGTGEDLSSNVETSHATGLGTPKQLPSDRRDPKGGKPQWLNSLNRQVCRITSAGCRRLNGTWRKPTSMPR